VRILLLIQTAHGFIGMNCVLLQVLHSRCTSVFINSYWPWPQWLGIRHQFFCLLLQVLHSRCFLDAASSILAMVPMAWHLTLSLCLMLQVLHSRCLLDAASSCRVAVRRHGLHWLAGVPCVCGAHPVADQHCPWPHTLPHAALSGVLLQVLHSRCTCVHNHYWPWLHQLCV